MGWEQEANQSRGGRDGRYAGIMGESVSAKVVKIRTRNSELGTPNSLPELRRQAGEVRTQVTNA